VQSFSKGNTIEMINWYLCAVENTVFFDGLQPNSVSPNAWKERISRVMVFLGLGLEVFYKFITDEEMVVENKRFLNHDTYTDIITFDLRDDGLNEANILISHERVKENAELFNSQFETELFRTMVHGLLHLSGQGDKTAVDEVLMRQKEDELIQMFHVEH
jgi:rRNA maturation RNase YbeY